MSDPKPALVAMGTALVNYTKRTFNDASLRAAPWPAKKSGGASNLKRDGVLWRSPRVVKTTKTSVTVGSDRVLYAAVHQLGSAQTGGIPARPFFPILNGQLTSKAAKRVEHAAEVVVKKVTGDLSFWFWKLQLPGTVRLQSAD
jgi:phage gpG-like protein